MVTSPSPRIALIGPQWRVPKPVYRSSADLQNFSSNNTGNMVFAYAISQQLGVSASSFGWNADPKRLKREFDVAVVMAANQIQPATRRFDQLGFLNKLLEQCDLPIIVIGLGVQAAVCAEGGQLDENSVRLLEILRDRKAAIAARGRLTAEVLEGYGIEDYAITGCPSNFLNPSPTLGRDLGERLASMGKPENIAVNCDVRPGLEDVVPPLARLLERLRGSWITQVFEDISFLRGDCTDQAFTHLGRMSEIMKPGADRAYIINFLKTYCHYFLDVEQWLDFLLRFDFSIGTRLHGNMMAWQAGVPAVWIPHDARTAELLKCMELPTLDRKVLSSRSKIGEILDGVRFDGEAYDQKRAQLARRYHDVLRKAGLELSPEYSWVGSLSGSAEATETS